MIKEHRMWCMEQVRRFSCLPFPPTEDAGVEEIINALERYTVDKPHALAVVDELIVADLPNGPRWPVPAEIRACALALKPETPVVMEKPVIHCSTCQDWGHVRESEESWKRKRCSNCEVGRNFPQSMLDFLNRPPKAPKATKPNYQAVNRLQRAESTPTPRAKIVPITDADIQAILEKKRQNQSGGPPEAA